MQARVQLGAAERALRSHAPHTRDRYVEVNTLAREDFVGATRDFLNSMAWRSPDVMSGADDTIDGGLDDACVR